MKTGFFLLAFILQLSASAQKDCSVLLQGLDSAYVGKCKDGLANGSGEAWGIFHYKGKFANGYPHGKGRADYRNGAIYDGLWELGKKSGEGTMYIKINGKVIEKFGFWRNDSLQKEILPNPYKVLNQRNVERVRIYREGEGNTVWFYPNALGGVANNLEDIQVTGNSGSSVSLRPKIGYQDITFPFTGSIKYKAWNKLRTTQFEISLEIEIFQPGSWIVEMQN